MSSFSWVEDENFFISSGQASRVLNENFFFLFLNQNICCGYSKVRSQRDTFLSTKTTVQIDSTIRTFSQFYALNFCLSAAINIKVIYSIWVSVELRMKIFLYPRARPLECLMKFFFSYFSTKTYVVGTQKGALNETRFWAPKQLFKLIVQ